MRYPTRYTVCLLRNGRVFAFTGTHNATVEDADSVVLVKHVEALSFIHAIGMVMLQLYDQTQQPHQHVCMCERPHIDDPFGIESRLT